MRTAMPSTFRFEGELYLSKSWLQTGYNIPSTSIASFETLCEDKLHTSVRRRAYRLGDVPTSDALLTSLLSVSAKCEWQRFYRQKSFRLTCMDIHTMSSSLSDLPDEILQICFARLPLEYLYRARAVCTRWHKLGDATPLRHIRKKLGVTQNCTFELDNEYISGKYQGLQGRAIDYLSKRVHPIATLDGPQRLQYSVVGADGLLYILGGRSPLTFVTAPKVVAWIVYSRVDVYEPLRNSWYEMQPMHVARYGFAAGAFVDLDTGCLKLIVAGGYDSEGEALHSAELYDFGRDQWEPIPSMRSTSGACKGEAIGGKFYVQQANGRSDTLEIYEPSLCRWASDNPQLSTFCLKASTEKNGTSKSVILDL